MPRRGYMSCEAFIPLMVRAWCMHRPFSMPSQHLLPGTCRLLNSCCHASPIPHALPIVSHAPWLCVPHTPLSRLTCHVPHTLPIVSHTPCLSTHGVEPSVCGHLPYPLPSPKPPCPACRRAPTHPLQCCHRQHPATCITLIRPTSSPTYTLTCLLGPAPGGHVQVTHRAP